MAKRLADQLELAQAELGIDGELGTLVVGHARTHPRGFTSLANSSSSGSPRRLRP